MTPIPDPTLSSLATASVADQVTGMVGNAVGVPGFQLRFSEDQITAAVAGFTDVLRSGTLLLGPHTAEFEHRFAELAGADVAAVSTGTAALEIIYRIHDVADRPVLVPTNTNFATARAVLAAGGRPVLYDGGLFPSLDDIERQLRPDTAAVTVVHIGGHLSTDLPALRELTRSRGIFLIEDAAHAHGSALEGRPAGVWGDAAAFSFFPTKPVTAFEGGAVVSNDPEILAAARIYRNQGKDPATGLHIVAGSSWRMSEVGAVLACVQLRQFADDLADRHAILERYRRELGHLDGLRFPEIGDQEQLSGHKAIVLLADSATRDHVLVHLRRHGITPAGGVYDRPLHQQPVFADLVAGHYPLAEEFAATHLCLPLWNRMTSEEIDAVIAAVLDAIG
ncbi:DegT/DnrJ/EryC1/StrS family aminotransferase [Nocardia fluminea]|uniref:DegT/DnrJ/EryC1/StrS family aminotransferase n=1 Tax=Nocardia fluminea TaxID=134984 RepID=UPI003D0B51FD